MVTGYRKPGLNMPAVPRDWADPFFSEAIQNLRAAEGVFPLPNCAATYCMLLQMVFEKMAKAAYARSGNQIVTSHQIVLHLFAVLDRLPNPASDLIADPGVRQFLFELETANPAEAVRGLPKDQKTKVPNIEYPWEDVSGRVLTPSRDHHLVRRVLDPRDTIAARCLRFAAGLERHLFTAIP